ncbi:MAG: type II toxin-antitoxin system PemK/MazF family toxin [Alphaproteobacteria bacterium]
MSIPYHPERGSIVECDFTHGFVNPEMNKKRAVIVLTPKIKSRHNLCTVVALSTTKPEKIMPYHCQIDITPPLPDRYKSIGVWVKGDMVNTVGFHRLDLIRVKKDINGKRIYYTNCFNEETMRKIYTCVLHGMGLSRIIKSL